MRNRFKVDDKEIAGSESLQVSGWDRHGFYFDECVRSSLHAGQGEKSRPRLVLHHCVAPDATIFDRRSLAIYSSEVLPEPYYVLRARALAHGNGWEYSIALMRPQKKAANGNEHASNFGEGKVSSPQPRNSSEGSAPEEVLHEA